jgi:hypothetical protein
MLLKRFLKMHDKVLLAGGQGGLKAGKYHWMIHAYQRITGGFSGLADF